jgi:GTPase SAR1 family protein
MPDQAPKQTPLGVRVAAALESTRDLALNHDRDDLAARLTAAQARIDDPSIYVLVVGEFKQGKSTLVNALVGQDVCPVDDDIATAVPTVLRHGSEPTASVLFQPPDQGDSDGPPPEPARETVPADQVAAFVTEQARPPGDRPVHSVELTLPSPILESGLVLVDTPGVGGLGSIHSTITMGTLPMAEALIFVSDASQEFTEPEIEFMESARSMCPNIVILMTKTDFYPAWRKVMALDEAHLERLGIKAEIIPVSSTLHVIADETGDAELDDESGFPQMREHLLTRIVGRSEDLSALKLASDLNGVLSQIQGALQTHKQALQHPEEVEAKQAEFKEAKERAQELQSRAARWQQTLQDGTADLNAEVDHDLRARFRKINQQVDDVLETIDPADAWDEFEPWLYQRVAEDVINNYKILQLQSRALTERVAEHFEIERAELDLVDLEVSDPTAGLSEAGVRADFAGEGDGALDRKVAVVRGGVMGSLVVSFPLGMAAAVLPVLAVASAVLAPFLMVGFGIKTFRDNKGTALKKRRAEAKTTQRKYMDEAQFLANKDARAAARLTQRELRDFFTTRAKEQSRLVDEHLAVLNRALQVDQKSAKEQLATVNNGLQAVNKVRGQVNLMSPQAAQ